MYIERDHLILPPGVAADLAAEASRRGVTGQQLGVELLESSIKRLTGVRRAAKNRPTLAEFRSERVTDHKDLGDLGIVAKVDLKRSSRRARVERGRRQ
jgi:hypothetical protein